MNDLSDFLLARIAEEESSTEGHRGVIGSVATGPIESGDGYAACSISAPQVLPARARRCLIAYAQELYAGWNEVGLLKLLALPYAEHADYRQEWRP